MILLLTRTKSTKRDYTWNLDNLVKVLNKIFTSLQILQNNRESLSHQVSAPRSHDLISTLTEDPVQPVQSQLETASQPSFKGKGILMTGIISTGLSYSSVLEDFAEELILETDVTK